MKGSQKKLETTMRRGITTRLSLALLASALVLSFVAAVQLATNNAVYAIEDEHGHSLIISCNVSEDGDATLTIDLDHPPPTDPTDFIRYDLQVLDSSGNTLHYLRAVPSDFQFQLSEGIQPGEQYTANLWRIETLSDGTLVSEEVVLTETATCESPPDPEPPLTEQFKNQGQCIAHANHNPNSGITKENCQERFKA